MKIRAIEPSGSQASTSRASPSWTRMVAMPRSSIGAEQAPHAVDERLAADEADVLMLLRLPEQMLAGAEADLEPDLAHRNREEIASLRERAP